MSLPDLLKHVYNYATDEVIRRGKKIFHTSGVHLLDHDPLTEQVSFRVRNDAYSNFYKVTIQQYMHTQDLSVRCQCPYNMGSVCRHEAAALFQLNDLLQSGFFDSVQVEYKQSHTTVRMRQITQHFIKLFSSTDIYSDAELTIVANKKVKITEAMDDAVKADVTAEGKVYPVVLKQNEERYFDTSCTCDEKRYPLCIHKAALFIYVLYNHGAHYFSTLRNWDAQKNKLLSLYGYSLSDDLSGKFDFAYHEGKPFLRVLDTSIKKLSTQTAISPKETVVAEPELTNKKLGVAINPKGEYYPFVDFDLIAGEPDLLRNKYSGKIEKLPVNKYLSINRLDEREKILVTALRRHSSDELIKFLKRNSPFGDFWDGLGKELQATPNEDLRQQVWDFYLPRYQKLLEQYKDYPFVYFLPEGKSFSGANLQQVKFSDVKFNTHLYILPAALLQETGDDILIQLQISVSDELLVSDEVSMLNQGLILHNNTLFAAANNEVLQVLERFPEKGAIRIKKEEWPAYLENELLPLSGKTSMQFHEALQDHITEEEPELRLYLRETDKMMSFRPVFAYNDIEKQWLDNTPAMSARDGKIIIHHRNEASEQTFLTMLRHMHPSMQESRKSRSFLLPAADALKSGWYFEFMDRLREANVAVHGYESLKQMRINPNKPVTNLQFTSGIDWFEAEMEVIFGDQKVTVADVKKALSHKQNFVTLADGSVGLLPDEWMERYSLMIKLGTVKGKGIQLKKFHFSAVEHLGEELGDHQLLKDLEAKRERLLGFDYNTDTAIQAPENLHADLRPYQLAGFQWFSFLNATGWGGILADDMGLGKTIQTLSYLLHYHNENPEAKFIVACPTTLMYNWENEIKKFAPDMTYHIYHGSARKSGSDEFKNADIIITTYGTLRSDIKMLSQINFDYVVLDESQAIKNPLSQVAKAAQQLQSKNRLALSGTPVQNNTFDLYAQMNFLNPGMLGSMDFFRNEFATPIDKMQEEDTKAQLRKLIYPFMLRRTKEQVAPDLPEKTEVVHICEMGSKQRKIYEAYRNSFRSKILGEIEDKGMERSQLSILTGLMKLRQICDSPAILNDEERFENHSVKIDELVRELTENTGNHKALVFSQFLGMLSLIRQELERLNIPYVYFDGSTSATEREKAIRRFQDDEECRVFLISLKAGGVGLNLTAADYVYIVDPWWNPAVEQQAIDRTHRIGQTKNIFAYRLICKDTIEEKIMLLQERKLSLVKDLVADDGAFLKKLTKDDVAYLLS